MKTLKSLLFFSAILFVFHNNYSNNFFKQIGIGMAIGVPVSLTYKYFENKAKTPEEKNIISLLVLAGCLGWKGIYNVINSKSFLEIFKESFIILPFNASISAVTAFLIYNYLLKY